MQENLKKSDLIYFNQKEKETNNEFDLEKEFIDLKKQIKNEIEWWFKAFEIDIAYKEAEKYPNMLAYSHRRSGWSNPAYKLSENFTLEFKTNFGYGSASYFYIKFKYKNIDIIPFSEWINYEIAKFSEIIRYTKSYPLKTVKEIYNDKTESQEKIESSWQNAINYTKTACNISLTDEVGFVRKYIIDECEKMIVWLEEIFVDSDPTLMETHYKVNKEGHVLIEFRGEKISGALDFISKILEFDGIIETKSFITRIEECNRRIQPILVEESKILKIKIENLTLEKNELKPEYDEIIKVNSEYNAKRVKLKSEMITNKLLSLIQTDISILEVAFISKYPEYNKFSEKYEIVTKTFRQLTEEIQNNIKVRNNIISYNEKISKYWGK